MDGLCVEEWQFLIFLFSYFLIFLGAILEIPNYVCVGIETEIELTIVAQPDNGQ
jgi:hypothetical protein